MRSSPTSKNIDRVSAKALSLGMAPARVNLTNTSEHLGHVAFSCEKGGQLQARIRRNSFFTRSGFLRLGTVPPSIVMQMTIAYSTGAKHVLRQSPNNYDTTCVWRCVVEHQHQYIHIWRRQPQRQSQGQPQRHSQRHTLNKTHPTSAHTPHHEDDGPKVGSPRCHASLTDETMNPDGLLGANC